MAGFRSFSRETRVDLRASGLRLVTGANLVRPRLGANGVGKSTIFDALTFALYGTSASGLRASDLVSYGLRATDVSAELSIDGQVTVVRRRAPPDRVYIDGEIAEQADVDRLVGLSRSRFLASVIFGQGQPLFLDLAAPARGDLLDEVLDLEMWMRAARLASTRAGDAATRLNALRVEIAGTRGQLDGLPDLRELSRMAREWETSRAADLGDLREQLRVLRRELVAVQRRRRRGPVLADAEVARKVHDDLAREVAGLREERAVVAAWIEQTEEDARFFEENSQCPTCGQEITAELADAHLGGHQETHAELCAELKMLDEGISLAAERLPDLREAWQQVVRDNASLEREHQLLAREERNRQSAVSQMEARIEARSSEPNPHSSQHERVAARRRELTATLAEQEEREASLLSEMSAMDYWRGGFRKARLLDLEDVLRELEVESRNAMGQLGLPGWAIELKTATETKSGTVRLGVRAEVRSDASDRLRGLSWGEGQRVRLAVSLGLASLIQRWAGVRWTMEVLDEPTAWLSEQGVEDLLELLATRAEEQRRTIWLCDHRALSAGAFSGIMQVVKDERGSRIQ